MEVKAEPLDQKSSSSSSSGSSDSGSSSSESTPPPPTPSNPPKGKQCLWCLYSLALSLEGFQGRLVSIKLTLLFPLPTNIITRIHFLLYDRSRKLFSAKVFNKRGFTLFQKTLHLKQAWSFRESSAVSFLDLYYICEKEKHR